MSSSKNKLLQELKRRAELKTFVLEEFCFDKQLAFIKDPAKFKTAVCSRRAGKSVACVADLFWTASSSPNVNVLYVTLSRTSAKRIVWNELLKLVKIYEPTAKIDNTELYITLANGSVIYVTGAKDESEANKFRGLSLKKVYIDECFHPDTLIETKEGLRPIKDVRAGDYVKNALGYSKVLETSVRQKDTYMSLTYGGKTVKCSTNHPFFTKRGWVAASDLQPGDDLVHVDTSMYLLQADISTSWPQNLQVLRNELQREVSTPNNKSDDERGHTKESEPKSKAGGAQTSHSGWKWAWAHATRTNFNGCFTRIKVEPCNWVRFLAAWLSKKLQSGLSIRKLAACNRSGWRKSCATILSSARPEERSTLKFIRLESATLHQSTSDRTNPNGYFHDITVEGHPSFTVNGALVHNCQSFRPYIKMLVDDILVPALYDYDGSLILIGTPGPICAGYFYDSCVSGNWSRHKWTMLDNPWIKRKSGKDPSEILKAERERRGITEQDPTYRRESLGEWVADSDALVFKFDNVKNTFLHLPKGRMEYIFGVDIGYDDSDAIAVLGYSYEDRCVYLVEEHIKSKQNITQLVEEINRLRDKYKPVRMVMDAGALGKKIQAEIQQRHVIPLEAADKNRKLEFIELLNDDLRTGVFKAYMNSRFEQDSYLEQWEAREAGQKPVISSAYHSDITMAVLYAWRECKHYLYQAPIAPPKFGTKAWAKELEEKLAADLVKEKTKLAGPTQDDMDFISDPDGDF
jgi:hypothetical protein